MKSYKHNFALSEYWQVNSRRCCIEFSTSMEPLKCVMNKDSFNAKSYIHELYFAYVCTCVAYGYYFLYIKVGL